MLKNVFKTAFMLGLLYLNIACTPEKNYRGVPEPAWQQLTAEQKQLIVDHSFHEEIQKS